MPLAELVFFLPFFASKRYMRFQLTLPAANLPTICALAPEFFIYIHRRATCSKIAERAPANLQPSVFSFSLKLHSVERLQRIFVQKAMSLAPTKRSRTNITRHADELIAQFSYFIVGVPLCTIKAKIVYRVSITVGDLVHCKIFIATLAFENVSTITLEFLSSSLSFYSVCLGFSFRCQNQAISLVSERLKWYIFSV